MITSSSINVFFDNVINEMLISDFKSFLLKSFYTLHPTHKFIDNWHIDLIVEYLQAIKNGSIKRVIINIPPRSLKSFCISIVWPAWILANDPTKKIIVVSYNKDLSMKHSQECRHIIDSQWFKSCFPNVNISYGSNTKTKFCTNKHGFRLATSLGSTLTGEGADIIILDDPQTPIQALSDKFRKKCIDWFESTLVSRLNDRRNGSIVIVTQRLHLDDLSGYLIKKQNWKLLKIPAIAKQSEEITFGNFSYYRKEKEQLYINTSDVLQNIKSEIGSYAFAAQYQQAPNISNIGIIKDKWFQYYTKADIHDAIAIYQSWDCAVKTGQYNDYTVCITFGLFKHMNNRNSINNVNKPVSLKLESKLESELESELKLKKLNKAKTMSVSVSDMISKHNINNANRYNTDDNTNDNNYNNNALYKTTNIYNDDTAYYNNHVNFAQNNSIFILDVFRKKIEFPEIKKTVINLYHQYSPTNILIEDTASGQQLIQELQFYIGSMNKVESQKREIYNNSIKNTQIRSPQSAYEIYTHSKILISSSLEEDIYQYQAKLQSFTDTNKGNNLIIGIRPKYDKTTRLMLISSMIESGRVYLPSNEQGLQNEWLDQLKLELTQFPYYKHDDQVDSITQFLLWLLEQEKSISRLNNGFNCKIESI